MRRVLLLGAVAAIVSSGAPHAAVGAVPKKLVATWVAKNGLRMTIKQTGVAVFAAPNVGSETVTISVTGARVTFGRTPVCVSKAVYSWSLSGRLLTLKVVSDPCTLRRALYAGVWRRR